MPAADGDGVLLGDADVDEATGEALAERQQAGGVGHGGGDGHHLGVSLALDEHGLAEGRGVRPGLELGHVVHRLDGVVLGRRVAAALLGEHVDDDRAVDRGGVGERLLEAGDVVAVEGADVAHAEVLEERRRLEDLADGGLGAVDAAFEVAADHRQFAQHLLEAGLLAAVDRVRPEARQALAEARHGGGVAAAVVVEDDDDVAAGVAEVVETLVGHAAGHRAVADDGDDATLRVALQVLGGGQPVGVGQHGRGVAVLDPVVRGLGTAGVAGDAARLADAWRTPRVDR